MKLALDAWYEAWGRAEGDEARAADRGEAVGPPGSVAVRDEVPGDAGGRPWTEPVGGPGPPPCPEL